MYIKKLLLIFSIFILFAFQAKGSPNFTNLNDSIQLNELVVTGTKSDVSRKLIPLSISQISRQNIENSGQVNILPALNFYSPGIFVTERNILGFGVSTGGSGSISMRGISSSPNTDVLVLVDGNPQYQGIFGHPLADAYVASDVEKVEIIRGPASLLYGSNAMAGVINIISKKQQSDGLRINLGSSYGSFNTQKYNGSLGYKKNKLSLFFSGNHDYTDGIRTNTDFKITNGYTKVGYQLNKHLALTADFNIAKYKGNDNGSVYMTPSPIIMPHTILATPAPFGIDISRAKASVSVENKFEGLEGALKIYHNFGEHTLSDGFHSTDRNSGAMLYQTIQPFSGNKTTLGSDFKQYGGISSKGLAHDSLITVNEFAVYFYTQQTLFEKLTLNGGIRIENNSKFGNEIVPLAGLTYNPSSTSSLKTVVSKGYRSPTIMEMYLYAPNPHLQPEHLMNYEISYSQSLLNNKLFLELTAFKIIGDNFIQVIASGGIPIRQNTGSFTNNGLEFSAKYEVNKNLFIHANYSYIDLSKAVIAAPRQQLNISANYNYKICSLNVSTQYIEKLYTFISPNPAVAPVIQSDYLLLNARLSVRPINRLELFVGGYNLLNKNYEINYGYQMPGINFNGGFNYRF